MNTFGSHFRFTSFGASHEKATGGVIDGCPAGMAVDFGLIEKDLHRRRTAQHNFSSPRNENDSVEFLSGIFEGKTTGAPIAFIIKNTDVQSTDYERP